MWSTLALKDIIASFSLLIWNVHQNMGNIHMDFCHTLYICYQFIKKGYLAWLYVSICRYLMTSFKQKYITYEPQNFVSVMYMQCSTKWLRKVVRIWVWEGEIFLYSVHLSKSTPSSAICRYFIFIAEMLHNSIFYVLKQNVKKKWFTKFYRFSIHVHAGTNCGRKVVRIWVCEGEIFQWSVCHMTGHRSIYRWFWVENHNDLKH